MSEIPQDVRDKAREIAAYCERAGLDEDIARAIMAERERCAKVAETLGAYPELNVFSGGPEWYLHGKEIAAAIRRGN